MIYVFVINVKMNNTDTNITTLIAINISDVQYLRGSTMRPSYNGTTNFTHNDTTLENVMIFVGCLFGVLFCIICWIIRRDRHNYDY